MSEGHASGCLVLRLAGPLQSWGSRSQFNRRETDNAPTKSGLIGLLAAAEGRRRSDPIEDLVGLQLGVRTDRPGTLLRDYHTVSDFRGRPLLSAAVNTRGVQKPTSPAKLTHVTERFYLQDAVFVAAVAGPEDLVCGLAAAINRPAFPLALGRRACVPTQPIALPAPSADPAVRSYVWPGSPASVLALVPWQSRQHGKAPVGGSIALPTTVDDSDGDDVVMDLPTSFKPGERRFVSRRVRHDWVRVPTGLADSPTPSSHDPFALLGW